MRMAIIGGPRTGKTTTAARLGQAISRHTDDLIGEFGWSEASEEASTWFDSPGPVIIEGVAVVRALRKWLTRNPDGKPIDTIIHLTRPHVDLSPGQRSLWKGHRTVWMQIEPELRRRGVEVFTDEEP